MANALDALIDRIPDEALRGQIREALKKQNQNLEKHKYVKDYRIKELKLNMKLISKTLLMLRKH